MVLLLAGYDLALPTYSVKSLLNATATLFRTVKTEILPAVIGTKDAHVYKLQSIIIAQIQSIQVNIIRIIKECIILADEIDKVSLDQTVMRNKQAFRLSLINIS